jgi:hypothetical protein
MQSDVAAGKPPAEIWIEFNKWASEQADPPTASATVLFQAIT